MLKPSAIDCYGLSDRGKIRETNEDHFFIGALNKSILAKHTSLTPEESVRLVGEVQGEILLVADGAGPPGEGESSSATAVDTIIERVLTTMPWFYRLSRLAEDELAHELRATLSQIDARLKSATATDPQHRHRHTRLTMAYLVWPDLYVLHVGNARCYLFREAWLEQITTDHTVGQQLAEAGLVTREQVTNGPRDRASQTVWNSVGDETTELMPDIYKVELVPGDAILLATDGLTTHLSNEQLSDILNEDLPAKETCERLIATANDNGGTDNITVVYCRFCED